MENFDEYLHHEIYINVFVQENFQFFEPLFEKIAVYIGPTWIMHYIMPILVCHDMILMMKAVLAISILDTTVGLMKWSSGMARPYWWVRENKGPTLKQHTLTCETTSGFPSAHSMTCTLLVYLIALAMIPHLQQQFKNNQILIKYLTYLIMWSFILMMWLDRLYLGSHFLHQCIIGSSLAFLFISLMYRPGMDKIMFRLSRQSFILMIITGVGIAVGIYYKQLFEGTELQSVKMAFKWCDKPENLRHESSPVYMLGRSFGLLLGVALSAPLCTRLRITLNPFLSIPITALIAGFLGILDLYTPKQYGRIPFVAYGVIRGTFLTYSLLNIIPYFCGVERR